MLERFLPIRRIRQAGVCLAIALSSVTAAAQQPPANVRVDLARMEKVTLQREVTGELRALRRSRLAAQEEGLVIKCELQPGDEVKEGDLIAELEAEPATLAHTLAKAEARAMAGILLQREAELEQAKRDLGRYNELDRSFSASEGELDRANTLVATLEAQVAQAQADVDAANVRVQDADRRLRQMRITAPFDGRVVRRLTDKGQWLSRGDEVLELVALDTLEAWIDVPETLLGALRGPEVTITIRVAALRRPDPKDPTRTLPAELPGSLIAIVPDVDPLSRLVPVRVSLKNAEGRLAPGMSIAGLVPTGSEEPRLTIHKDAILRDDAGEFVFVNLNGQAIPMRIRSRFAFGDRVVIDDGSVFPGAQVIVEGNERLYPTQPVAPSNAPPGGSAPAGGPPGGAPGGGPPGAAGAPGANPGQEGER